MDSSLVLIGACTLVFGILPFIFRVNAAALFLTLCAGSVVSKLVAQDVTQIINSFINVNIPMFSIVQITLLVIAPVILLFGLKGGVKVGGLVWQIIPAAAAAILAVMFIATMLPYDIQKEITESKSYGFVSPYFGLAAAAGLFASFLQLWAMKPRHHDKHGKKHKK